jgi:hypothetical protein
MGVTIHFEGQLKSETYYDNVMKVAKDFADENAMPYSFFSEANKVLERVKDEKDWNYEGATKGIKIQPDVNSDPLWLEFDTNNYIQEYCKTQFADIEIHIKIINLLQSIKPFFSELIVMDEGEYWETESKDVLQNHIDTCNRVMEERKQENKKMSGPFRITDGRIVDLMEGD